MFILAQKDAASICVFRFFLLRILPALWIPNLSSVHYTFPDYRVYICIKSDHRFCFVFRFPPSTTKLSNHHHRHHHHPFNSFVHFHFVSHVHSHSLYCVYIFISLSPILLWFGHTVMRYTFTVIRSTFTTLYVTEKKLTQIMFFFSLSLSLPTRASSIESTTTIYAYIYLTYVSETCALFCIHFTLSLSLFFSLRCCCCSRFSCCRS